MNEPIFPVDGFYCVTCREFTAGVTIKDGKVSADGTAPIFDFCFGRTPEETYGIEEALRTHESEYAEIGLPDPVSVLQVGDYQGGLRNHEQE